LKIVYWDTMLFIYFVEAKTEDHRRVHQVYRHIRSHGHRIITSTITLGEMLVPAYKENKTAAGQLVRELLDQIDMFPLDKRVAEHFAQIRAVHSVQPPDAIHLATAALHKADVFLTNDRALQKLKVRGIGAIQGIDRIRF
jgi:predicted nucleic acid-binding protein